MRRNGLIIATGIAVMLGISACGNTESEDAAAIVQETAESETETPEPEIQEDTSENEEAAETVEEDLKPEEPEIIPTYVEEHGLKFCEETSVQTRGIAANQDDLSDYIYMDTESKLGDIVIGDSDVEGCKTVTIEQSVSGYAWTDGKGKEFKVYINVPTVVAVDTYTGLIIPFESAGGDAETGSNGTDIEWGGETYHVSYTKEMEWMEGDGWKERPDGSYVGESTCYTTLTFTISKDYDGLALFLPAVIVPDGTEETEDEEAGDVEGTGESEETSDSDDAFIMDYWEDEYCFLFKIDTSGESEEGVAYVEKHGIEYQDGNSVGTNGLAIDENNLSDFIITDVTWNLSDISIEDADAEGFKTITTLQKVEGYRWSDGENEKRFVNFPSALLVDANTGLVFPYQGFVRNDQTMEQQDVDISWDGEDYHISYGETKEWVYGDHWEKADDGYYKWKCTFYDTYTITVPENYDGLALLLPSMFKEIGNIGKKEYIMDYWEDSGCYLFSIDKALEMAAADSSKKSNTGTSGGKGAANTGSGQSSGAVGEKFDPAFYASTYPDVAAACGTDVNALYNHYLAYGKKEGRMPYAGAAGGEAVNGIADTKVTASQPEAPAQSTTVSGLVPINQLANYASVKKNLTDAEFQAAYDAAVGIVQPLIGLSAEDQLRGIQQSLRARFDAGMSYSTSAPHYNDPYGYLVLGTASCAGSARTTGLCLNMLGYSFEHVNENQWSHQWCRVNLNGTYWICDPYGLYAGPEPYAYGHPLVP